MRVFHIKNLVSYCSYISIFDILFELHIIDRIDYPNILQGKKIGYDTKKFIENI